MENRPRMDIQRAIDVIGRFGHLSVTDAEAVARLLAAQYGARLALPAFDNHVRPQKKTGRPPQ